MKNLTKALLSSAALCALAPLPAVAGQHPGLALSAVHAGHVVNKTKFHNPQRQHVTYTFSAYSTIPMKLNEKVLLGTFYRWNSTVSGTYTICSNPKQKVVFPSKKTAYGKLNAATQTYSSGCPSGPTTYYGAAYKLTDSNGFGNVDHFRSSLIGKFNGPGGKYKGSMNIDHNLTILQK